MFPTSLHSENHETNPKGINIENIIEMTVKFKMLPVGWNLFTLLPMKFRKRSYFH